MATLLGGDILLGLLEFHAGSLGLPVQSQRRGPRQILLAVEKVGAVLGVQAVVGASDQTLGLITGHRHDLHLQAVQRLLQGRRPGLGIAALLVGLQEQEVGGRFDSHQAGLVPMEVLIQASDDALDSHASSQALLFALAIGEDLLL